MTENPLTQATVTHFPQTEKTVLANFTPTRIQPTRNHFHVRRRLTAGQRQRRSESDNGSVRVFAKNAELYERK